MLTIPYHLEVRYEVIHRIHGSKKVLNSEDTSSGIAIYLKYEPAQITFVTFICQSQLFRGWITRALDNPRVVESKVAGLPPVAPPPITKKSKHSHD